MNRYLLYISENYGFEILRPLQAEMHKRGEIVAWFVEGESVNSSLFRDDETRLSSVDEIIEFDPVAVYVPGNVVPSFIPGLKVQIFHGFEWKKKGHFRIRNCFDLYCTQGPLFTNKFESLQQSHQHFKVVETGWPKIDDLMSAPAYQWKDKKNVKTILYAPTFSPAFSSVEALFETIKELSAQQQFQWLIKFHPKMDQEWVERYRRIQSPFLHVVEIATISPVLQAADVMISDTSSVITEFALLEKPVITFKNSAPEDNLINIENADELQQSLQIALSDNKALIETTQRYTATMHPYSDGQSSYRVIKASLDMLSKGRGSLREKPANVIRNLKLRKKLHYWKFW